MKTEPKNRGKTTKKATNFQNKRERKDREMKNQFKKRAVSAR
jgi:hypothetical protein